MVDFDVLSLAVTAGGFAGHFAFIDMPLGVLPPGGGVLAC